MYVSEIPTCLSRGISTPLMRAISALPLLVTRVFADDHDTAVATNHLALVTDLLDAWSNFHFTPGRIMRPLCAPARAGVFSPEPGGLLVAIGDTTTLQV